MGSIIVRTHGGLGNQLFQFFLGYLYSQKLKKNLILVHDDRYAHKFQISERLQDYVTGNYWHKFFSSFRIPKVLSKLGVSNSGLINIFGDIYLDGYFQDVKYYREFDSLCIQDGLKKIRIMYDINQCYRNNRLVHLRIGDFFGDVMEEREFIVKELGMLNENDMVISNNEDLVSEVANINGLGNNYKILKTGFLSSDEVMRMMSEFRIIKSNNSTIAFWAAIMSGASYQANDLRLNELYQKLS